MRKILSSNKTYVTLSKIPNASRGVFANVAIAIGETIEKCPVIEIPKYDFASLDKSILITYVYFFGKNKERIWLTLGFGSLYNHNYVPNAMYKIKPKEKIVEFISLKGIKKNEEITINYLQGNQQSTPLWFER